MDEKKGRANVDEDFDVSVDKEFPFLIEMDLNAYKEGVTGVDNFYVESVNNFCRIVAKSRKIRVKSMLITRLFNILNIFQC